ncbi:CHAP domain-containing protein [Nonomuraea basaltis]|uniref:CHAP domain-containing protein n=1 Tax=Nonomuraea basaltis TaxID=2495887 RepID=UPI00110C4F09|nr:CHAP domain-containing protein [Nonomuraea basaltis]TMS00318.1 CHAP domain-containing protein [Nonomuraea basaltis]
MTKTVLSRALKPANSLRLLMGTTVAAGALFAATPAFAADHQGDRAAGVQVAAKKPAQVTANSIIKIAESQVGVTENAAGGGTPFHAWYMASQRARETVVRDGGSIQAYANAPWCAMFVSWVGEKAGARPTVGWDAYTITYAKWFEKNGRWGTQAKPGAVVYFSWDDRSIGSIDHMGLVKKDNGDGTITTIEGNTGNGKVEERIRPTSQVVGYGYPHYKA